MKKVTECAIAGLVLAWGWAGPAFGQGAGHGAGHGGVSGRVVETMDSGGYTYLHLDTGTGTEWAATSKSAVEVGNVVALPPGGLPRQISLW